MLNSNIDVLPLQPPEQNQIILLIAITFLSQFLQLISVILLDLASFIEEMNQSRQVSLGIPCLDVNYVHVILLKS